MSPTVFWFLLYEQKGHPQTAVRKLKNSICFLASLLLHLFRRERIYPFRGGMHKRIPYTTSSTPCGPIWRQKKKVFGFPNTFLKYTDYYSATTSSTTSSAGASSTGASSTGAIISRAPAKILAASARVMLFAGANEPSS